MYKIIGADQREYGPVSAEELKQWIREGRANAQSRVQAEGSAEWRPLGTIPEFAALTGPAQPYVTAPGALSPTPARKNNSMAVSGLVCSLIGLPCCGLFIFSVLGLIFSIIGLKQINRDPSQGGKNMAIAGLVISLVTLFLSIAGWLIILVSGVSQNSDVHF